MEKDKIKYQGDDIPAIRKVIEEAVENQHNPVPFLALHSEEVVIVNFTGKRVLGREKLESAMQQALASPLAKVITKNTVEDIRFIKPEVAIVSCIKHVFDERTSKEKEYPSQKGSLTYVLVKENNKWTIALAQTTPILSL